MRKLLLASTSLLFVCAGASAVRAQTDTTTANTASAATLTTVTVTADKRKVNLQKAAVDATVLKGETLKAQGKERLDDILNGVIGVATQETQVGPQYYIRGVGQQTGAPGGPAGSAAVVAVYIDGVYQDRSEATRGGTLDMDQVEVARGPQGTSLGANSMAGAVSLTSNEPNFNRSAELTLGRGNYNHILAEGVINQPFGDQFAVRIAANSDTTDGYMTSGLESTDNKEIRGKILWQPSSDLKAVLTIDNQMEDGNTGSGNNLAFYGNGQYAVTGSTIQPTNNENEFRTRTNPWNDGVPYDYWNTFRHTTINSAHLNVDYNLDFATLTVTPNVEQTNYLSKEAPRAGGPGGGVGNNAENEWETTESFEAKLVSPTNQRLSWVTGAYFYHTDETDYFDRYTDAGGGAVYAYPAAADPSNANYALANQQSCLGFGATCASASYTPLDEATNEAVYLNATYSVFTGFRIHGGLRWDNSHKEVQSSGNFTGGLSPTFGGYTYSPVFTRTVNRPSYALTMEYDVTPTAMAYYTFSTGFQTGGQAGGGGGPGGPTTYTAVGGGYYSAPSTSVTSWGEPQELYSNALGLKARWFDNRLQTNAELYYDWYNNYNTSAQIDYDPANPDACELAQNAPPGSTVVGCYSTNVETTNLVSKGVDLDVTYLPTPNDKINVSFGYLEATWGAQGSPFGTVNYEGFNVGPALDSFVKSFSGATLQNSPKFTINTTVSHTFDFGDRGSLTPSLNWIHKSSYYSNLMGGNVTNDPFYVQPTSDTINVYLNYTTLDGKYSVQGFANNVTDAVIVTNSSNGGPPGSSSVSSAASVDLAPPREYGVNVTAKF